ncbi:hypothetical protein mRhiFer1_009335 [Rhinolophus ferrumequinum]|uniref:Uncharacterized protein n=1 Tax=Rhinolophus ferrumequinum TaxID=59479 RepID=A0A7J7RXY3_RHIFE|nr:hypothetical protein mRhiFer1_009335 [Rhinolophus ferrumequinum]
MKQKDQPPPSPTTGDKLWETVEALAIVRSRCYDRIGPAPSYRPDPDHCSRDSPQPMPEAEGRVRMPPQPRPPGSRFEIPLRVSDLHCSWHRGVNVISSDVQQKHGTLESVCYTFTMYTSFSGSVYSRPYA